MVVQRKRRLSRRRRAAMLVLIAVTLPLFLIMAAFTVDVAWMQLVRTELRTATDAAARAAKELGLSQNESEARECKEAAARNLVAGDPLLLADADIVFGQGSQPGPNGRFNFTPGGAARLNAVRVTGNRLQSSLGGSVDLLFAGVLGVRDFQPQESATSVLLDRDICLVVDRSGSMMERLNGTGVPGPTCGPPHPTLSRWGSLNTAVIAFLDELERTDQEEHLALASYSSDHTECGRTYRIAETNSDLSRDYEIVRDEMARIGGAPVKGFTAISAGLDEGIDVLTGPSARPFAVPTMILMTDGIHNRGPAIISARRAADLGIVIHTITFSSEADINRMRAVVRETGGQHFHADNLAELVQAFRQIAATLPVLLTE